MELTEIEKHLGEDAILIGSVFVWSTDGGEICKLHSDGSHPDVPVVVSVMDKEVLRVANRDVPRLIKALSMLCNEDYF